MEGWAAVSNNTMSNTTEKPLLPLNSKGNRRGMHPNARAAIQPAPNPIKKGEIRNPGGLSVTSRVKLAIARDEVCPYDPKGRTWGDALKDSLLRQALNKVDGMRELLDRIEGKVVDKHLIAEVDVLFVIGKGYKEIDNAIEQG